MVTKEDVKRSADVSKIAVNELEIDTYTDDLNDMINFIDMINEKDFSQNDDFIDFRFLEKELRKDFVKASFSHDDVFKNTDLREEEFFVLKRKD